MTVIIPVVTATLLSLIPHSFVRQDKKGDSLPAKEIIERFEAAARPLRSKLPQDFSEARFSTWREHEINEIGGIPISTARFIGALDKGIIGQRFSGSGIVATNRGARSHGKPVIVLNPVERDWKFYVTLDEKRVYGKKTGILNVKSTKRFESDDDRTRDKAILEACHQRKQECEELLLPFELGDLARLGLTDGAAVDVDFAIRDLSLAPSASPQKLRISGILVDIGSLVAKISDNVPDDPALGSEPLSPLFSGALLELLGTPKRLVIVVDFSGSATVIQDDIKALVRTTISALTPEQSVQLHLFYSVANPRERFVTESFDSALVKADAETKRKLLSWLDGKTPRGQTEPLESLKMSLALKPDSVLFISDGLFDNSVIAEITKANNGAVAINCVVADEAILNDRSGLPRLTDGAKRMQTLASKNKGKTKVVTKSDLGP